MRNLKIFRAYLNGDLQQAFTYPAMMAVWMFETFFLPFTVLILWLTILHESPDQQLKQSLINYYITFPIVANLTGAWHGTFLAKDIRTGELNKYLTKPASPFYSALSNNITEKIVKTIIITPMILFGTLFYSPDYTSNLLVILLFILALTLSAAVAFSIDNFIGIAGFWFDQVYSIKNLIVTADLSLGGRLIPIFMFPPLLRQISTFLPFRYLVSFPVEILSNTLSLRQIVTGLTIQITWLLALWFLSVILWRKGNKKYGAYGG